jgi:hypothetical protein
LTSQTTSVSSSCCCWTLVKFWYPLYCARQRTVSSRLQAAYVCNPMGHSSPQASSTFR